MFFEIKSIQSVLEKIKTIQRVDIVSTIKPYQSPLDLENQVQQLLVFIKPKVLEINNVQIEKVLNLIFGHFKAGI